MKVELKQLKIKNNNKFTETKMKKYFLVLVIITLTACQEKDADEIRRVYKSGALRDYIGDHRTDSDNSYLYIDPPVREYIEEDIKQAKSI